MLEIVYVMMVIEVKIVLKDLFTMVKFLIIMWFVIKIGSESIVMKSCVNKIVTIMDNVKMEPVIAMTDGEVNCVIPWFVDINAGIEEFAYLENVNVMKDLEENFAKNNM